MKKIILLSVFLLLLTGCNGQNSPDTNESNALMIFSDTGIDVRNNYNRVYHIVKDKNGYLYYCTDVSNDLEVVLDQSGKPTKDINIFSK